MTIEIKLEKPTSAVASDLIRDLSAELARQYPDSHGGDGAGAFKPQDVMIDRAAFVVAWDGDTPVGCGALRPMDDETVAEVKRMYVRPGMRGKGISRLILLALEEHGRGFSYRALRLETGARQIEAIGLYQSAGYQPIPCYGIYINEPLSRCYEKTLEHP